MIPIQPVKDNDTIVTIKNSNIYKAGAKKLNPFTTTQHSLSLWDASNFGLAHEILHCDYLNQTSLEVLSHGIKSICSLAFYIYKMKFGIFVWLFLGMKEIKFQVKFPIKRLFAEP